MEIDSLEYTNLKTNNSEWVSELGKKEENQKIYVKEKKEKKRNQHKKPTLFRRAFNHVENGWMKERPHETAQNKNGKYKSRLGKIFYMLGYTRNIENICMPNGNALCEDVHTAREHFSFEQNLNFNIFYSNFYVVEKCFIFSFWFIKLEK